MKSLGNEEEAWFLQFVQDLPSLAWAKDVDGRYVFVNSAAASAFGRPESDILGRTDFDLFDSTVALSFRRNDELALEKGDPLQTFETLPDRNGVPRYSLVTKFPIKTASGLIRIAGTAVDVTDQRGGSNHEEFLSGVGEKLRVEAALLDRNEQYRTLFETMNQGFAIAEIITDEAGHVSDYRMIDINPQFERLTGQSREKFLEGRTVREVAPELEEEWYEFYGSVGLTGVPAHREIRSDAWDKWFEVSAYPTGHPGQRRVAILFSDITERKRRESNLAFLAEIDRDLVDLKGIDITMSDLGKKIATHFGLSHCMLVEIDGSGEFGTVTHGWQRADKAPIAGVYRVREFVHADFEERSRNGETIVVRDTSTDPLTDDVKFDALDVASFVNVPLVRNGQWRFWLGLFKSEPHEWSWDEVELAQELTARIWNRLERSRAEEALRESEARFRNMADHAPMMIWVTESDGTCSYLSQSWYEFTGQTPETGLGLGFLDAMDPADRERDSKEFQKAVESRSSYHSEHRLRRADGTYAWVISSAQPRFAESGEFLGHIGSILDITERRAAESDIRNTAERLDLAQRAGNVGIWDWNAETDTTYWSDQMWAFYGVAPRNDDPTRSGFWVEHLHEKDRVRVLSAVEELLSGDKTDHRNEFRIVREDGEVRWLESAATVERTKDGRPKRMYGVNLDITDRKSIEERIRASEAQLRLVTDSIPALLSYIGSDGRYKFVNRRYTDWFDRPEIEIVGKSMSEVLGKPAVDSLKPHLRNVLRGERVNFETWLDYKGAGRKFVNVSYVPDLRHEGEVPGFYALVTDLTEQRRSEERLRFSEEKMKTLTESFTDYAILSLDCDGKIESWNSGAVNIFGYSDDEIIGQPGDVLFTPEDVTNRVPQEEMRNAREFGRASDERWHLRKDGSRFFASGVMVPLLAGGELTGYAKIATDLTEKRRQTEELQTAYEEMENRVLHRTQELRAANESLMEQINKRESEERHRIRLLQRIVTSQEDERRRIARDLHDQLGQRLTALRLKLASLSDMCASNPELHARATRLQQIAELLDSEVGFLAWQIRPTALDELGLIAALETFVLEWSRHYSKTADFHVSGIQDLRLLPEVETQIYRITQEALNNVVKHAKAERASVILERIGAGLVLIVEDDGVGFDPDLVEGSAEAKHGMGLPGMKERAELIDGEIEVESKGGRGTTIYIRVPLNARTMEAGEYE